MTVGDDKLECTNDISSPTSSMLEIKLPIDSVIFHAKKGARFLIANLNKYFFANNHD